MSVTFEQTELSNGLTIIAEVNGAAHTAAGGFFVNTGTRDEPAPLMGVSHFLEHMMFKGSDRRTADQVNIEFDEIGANYNAFTSQENTAYFANVLPEYLDRAIDLLADILRPALRDEDFTREKDVILEEIGMYMDRPFWVAYEHAMERYFGDHPLAMRVLGTNDTIKAMTCPAMRDYFARHYGPDNMVVALSGRLDFEKVVAQVTECCGAWPRTGARRNHGKPVAQIGRHAFTDAKISRHYMVMLMPGPSRQAAERHAAAVLANILGDSDGSRLYWKLIDPGLAEEADLVFYPFDATGTFMAYASCPPARAEQVEAVMRQVLAEAAQNLTDDEVERSRSKIAMELVVGNERPMGRMMSLGGEWLYTGQYRTLAEQLADIEQVDRQAVCELAERYMTGSDTTVVLSPGDDAGAAAG